MRKLRNVWDLSKEETAAMAEKSAPATRSAHKLVAGLYAEMCFLAEASDDEIHAYLPQEEAEYVLTTRQLQEQGCDT